MKQRVQGSLIAHHFIAKQHFDGILTRKSSRSQIIQKISNDFNTQGLK